MTVPTDHRVAREAGPLAVRSSGALARSPFPSPLRPGAALSILDITKYFGDETGGIRTYLMAKARYVESRPEYRAVMVVPGANDSLSEGDGVRWYRLRGPRIPFDASYRFLLATRTTRRILEHERPQLIELGSCWFVPWVTRRANRGLRAPLVWFYHTHFPRIVVPTRGQAGWARRRLSETLWAYARTLGRVTGAVLVASESVAGELEAHGVERVRRVSLGVDLDRFHPARRADAAAVRERLGISPGPMVLYLGRFTAEKQLAVAVEAWREIERQTGATLVLAGRGPAQARLAALATGRRVVWLPFVRDREAVADLLAAADAYLAPGPAETFGLSALEAMASGTPVLSVDAGGVAERIRRSGAGRLYPEGDRAGLAEAAVALLSGDRTGLGELARRYAERHHAWETAFDGVFAVYRDVIGQTGE